MRTRLLAAVCAACLASLPAGAEDLRTERTVALGLANEIVAAAVQACAASGYHVTGVVVDRFGFVKAMQRADNANPFTLELARKKAFTSAMLRYETAKLAENIRNGVTPPSITQTDGFTGLIGGFPLRVGNEVVGGIGVSGAPGGELDSVCAEAGMKLMNGRV